MSPDDKLSDWASHAVAPDDPPDPSPGHLDSADDALSKLFGDEVTPEVTRSHRSADDAGTQVHAAGAAGGAVRIDGEPVTGPQPAIDVATTAHPGPGAADHDADHDADQRSRRERRKDWRRTEKARRLAARKSVRFPIFTRSILLWMLIFALVAVAFGLSGAFWWTNFNTRVSDIEQGQDDFENRWLDAEASIEQKREDTLTEIEDAAGPIKASQSGSQMAQLAQALAPIVFSVETFDEEGLASPGTAFAVIDDGGDAYFVTSYATVRAATVEPAPPVRIRQGDSVVEAELWNWDASRDLALLKAPIADVVIPEWLAGNDQARLVGSYVFPVTGVGGVGAAVTNGLIIDQSADGFQHDAKLGAHFRGGPMLDIDQRVVGVASLDYFPLGFDPGPQIHFAVPIDQVCQRLISCGGGGRTPAAQGAQDG